MKEKFFKNPKVSVIVPTYNRGWILSRAIDSVLKQNYSNIELLVVDDGSVDNTFEILKSYGSRIKFIYQSNAGVSAARNAGIRATSGKFVSFLDSDDEWLQSKVFEQIKFFTRNPSAVICQTEEIWIRNGKRVNPKKRHKKISGMIFDKSLEICLVSPSAVMLKRALLDEVGMFDESLPACEDYDLWLRVTLRHPVFLLDLPLVSKTGGHSDQLSKMSKLDKFRIKSISKILRSNELSSKQRQTAIAVLKKKCLIYISGCLKRDKYFEAEQYKKIISNLG